MLLAGLTVLARVGAVVVAALAAVALLLLLYVVRLLNSKGIMIITFTSSPTGFL